MAQAEKPAATETTDAPPKKKSKKLLIIIIAIVVVLAGGGVAAFFLLRAPISKPGGAMPEEAQLVKYVELGTFTVNLIREEDERYLHVAISLKLNKPELEEKIKADTPEILHRVNMVLQSKRPSQVATFEGKEMLAKQVKEQVEYVLGLRKIAPPISSDQGEAAPTETIAIKSGITDVLFTSFIIQ